MRATRYGALLAACVSAIAAEVARAQDARGTVGLARADRQGTVTNAILDSTSSGNEARSSATRESPSDGGGVMLNNSGAGGVQRENLEVVLDLLSGAPQPAPPPPSGGGGGAVLKAASALGGRAAEALPEAKAPADMREEMQMDASQRRKKGS